jgi:hypothetical protein|tara:strand:+ start:2993 stop:3862 length:870 start_codon:yes stop_codon:yes gene_type:complete
MSFYNKEARENLDLAAAILKEVRSTGSEGDAITKEVAASVGRTGLMSPVTEEENPLVAKLLAEGANKRRYETEEDDDGGMFNGNAGENVINFFDTLRNSFDKKKSKSKEIPSTATDDVIDMPEVIPTSLVVKPKKETPKTTSTVSSAFNARIRMLESSDNDRKQITLDDGKTMTGGLQFSDARLIDAKKGMKIKFTTEEFKNDSKLQRRVEDWHFKDIDRAIDSMGDKVKEFNRDGLRLVAHLGGITGMKNFVKKKLEGKEYNPKDKFGTSLQDYYDEYKTIEDYSATV